MAWLRFKVIVVLWAIAFLVAVIPGVARQSVESEPAKQTFSSFDSPTGPAGQRLYDVGGLRFDEAELTSVLALYETVSARTVVRGEGLPKVTFSLHNQTPLNRVETLQLLDTLLAANGVTMVLNGTTAVKAVPSDNVTGEVPPTINRPADQLPDSSSYMTTTVPLENLWLPLDKRTQAQIVQVMWLFSHSLRDSVTVNTNSHQLVLRDYSANVRQMLCLLEQFNPASGVVPVVRSTNTNVPKRTFSSFDAPVGPAGQLQVMGGQRIIEDTELPKVLEIYQAISGRTVIRSARLPQVKMTLRNQAPLNRVETLQALDNLLAQNGVSMVLIGDNAVKATDMPNDEVAPIINLPADKLPDSSSYMLAFVRPNQADLGRLVGMMGMKAQQPNGIIYAPSAKLLILRDYSSSVREMLRILQDAEK